VGQYNPNKVPGKTPEVNEDITISLLINSVHYFIQCVYIIHSKNKYRLVALHNRRVLINQDYSTEKGCRIAFGRVFKDRAWDKRVTPFWSQFYNPDKKWLEEKQNRIKAGKNSPESL